MEWGIILSLIIGTIIIVFLLALIWSMLIGGTYAAFKKRKHAKTFKEALSGMTCSVDVDCPPGYICMDGYCVPR